jgi:hypothetical protein
VVTTRRHVACDVKADGLQELTITMEDKLIHFSPTRPVQPTLLLICPKNRYDIGLPYETQTQTIGLSMDHHQKICSAGLLNRKI